MNPIETTTNAKRTRTALGLCACLTWMVAGCGGEAFEAPTPAAAADVSAPVAPAAAPAPSTAPAVPARVRAASGVLPNGLVYRRLTPDEVKAHFAAIESAQLRAAARAAEPTAHQP